jgi:hypothetical protein
MRSPKVLLVLLLFATRFTLAQLSDPQLHNGMTFVASVDHSIRASHAKPGDPVNFRLAQSFLLNGDVVPEGAKITGHIVVARKVDKKTKLDSLLAIVADEISWKKKSVSIRAWVVGFGSVRFSAAVGNEEARARLDPRMKAIMAETTDRPAPIPVGQSQEFGGAAGSAFAATTVYDPTAFVRDLKVVRNPEKRLGTLLVHDDGDIYLPKSLLVLMEQIDSSS